MHFFLRDGSKILRKSFENVDEIRLEASEILWIDLLRPNADEINFIAKIFDLKIPTKEEREEIEESARYWEDAATITINSYFLIHDERETHNETVTFILFGQILFSIRYRNFKVFDEIQRQVLLSPKHFEDGADLVNKIYEVRVEKDADMLEDIAKGTKILRKNVFEGELKNHSQILGDLSNLQEMNMSVRDSLFDKRRAITQILKSPKIDGDIKKNLTIALKDLNSLVEFTTANMNTLDNIQTLLTNQINIEQNKIIKIFTVATVAMMPPTLIGTIYGMNFTHMPELSFAYSYPIVLLVMVISTALPVLYFKKKGWL